MGSLSSFKCGFKNLLREIDIFTKYALPKPLKDVIGRRLLHSLVKESKAKMARQ